MFVSSHGTHPADIAFFSGFVAGDGSFLLRENNAGSTWCCELQVKLRADDTPLLRSLRDWSGAGELRRAPAQGRSQPQTAWTVARRRDCLRIVELLDEFPPLGKAARQFDVWRRAVVDWDEHGGASPRLSQYGFELRSLHRSCEPVPCSVDISRESALAFLGGFAAAEAHFGASAAGSPAFVINVRADDGPLLRCFRDAVGVGNLRKIPAAGSSQAGVSWRIGRLADLRVLVSVLDEFPPRGRAGGVYDAWRELVLLEPRTTGARRTLAAEVRQRRVYRPELGGLVVSSAQERSQRRCLDALKAWDATRDSPGTAGEYARWRRRFAPEAPTRNTMAAAFGSWRDALEAAGLSCERSLSPARIASMQAGPASRAEARRAEIRSATILAVRQCIAELGREPRAMEFLRWRNQNSQTCPSAMTLYRTFRGGFPEILAAARAPS